MLHKVEAIVIRSMDYGEGNKIITLFTRDWGKVGVMARGAKKLKSRNSAITQLFTYGEYVYFKSSQMGTLNHGEIIESHHLLREDLAKTAYGAYLVEMVDRSVAEQEPNEFLFEQLKAGLTAIEEGKDAQITAHIFEMKILALSGYAPVVDECVACGESGGEWALSISLGGVLCSRCRQRDPAAVVLSEGTLKLLRLLRHVDLRRLGKVEVKPETRMQLKRCMRDFMDTHIGVKWKSRNFLDQMDKYELS